MEGEKKDWEEMLNGRQVVLSAGLFREFQEKGGKRDEGISFWGDRRSIGGVTADFRADRFTKSCSWLFMPLTDEEIAEDDTDFHVKIAVRVNPSADHDFPEFFVKQMEKQLSIDRLYLLDVIPYSDLRYSMELRNGVKSELQNQIAVMGFLLFNIFLGIIGTFWFRTEQRKGELAVLTVADVGRMGAFLDWGLEKDLFLPFKEQTEKVEKGDQCLVSLYIDKSERLCATMKIYHLLWTDSPYKKDDTVRGTIYEVNREIGAFVAVDNLYSALIPKREMYGRMSAGQEIEARVAAVKEDGKLDLSVRGKIPQQMDEDAELILDCIETCGGRLPFTDKADPEQIKMEMGMSKAAFKRAVGRLLKQRKIQIREDGIYRL